MKTIISWLKIVHIPKASLMMLVLFLFVDAASYVVIPLSFAKIVASATWQNFSLTLLWAGINFMLQLLSLAVSSLSSSKIKLLVASIKTNLSHSFDTSTTDELSKFLSELYKCTGFVMKVLSILISSLFFSLKLSIYLLVAILVCTVACWLERKQITKKKTTSQTSPIWGNLLWSTFTYAMIVFIIYELRMQVIGLTAFLFLSTFISTHLLRPNFNDFFSLKIKDIKMLIKK